MTVEKDKSRSLGNLQLKILVINSGNLWNCALMCQLIGPCQYAVMLHSSHSFCILTMPIGQEHAWKLYEMAALSQQLYSHHTCRLLFTSLSDPDTFAEEKCSHFMYQ